VDVSLDADFADGHYSFDLKLPQVLELQEKCGKGIFAIYSSIQAGRGLFGGENIGLFDGAMADYREIRETIRLGLIGGNCGIVDGEQIEVGPLTAKRLVENYVDTRPMQEGWALASAILGARILGASKKKVTPEKAETETE
jgi:hypothetical protein